MFVFSKLSSLASTLHHDQKFLWWPGQSESTIHCSTACPHFLLEDGGDCVFCWFFYHNYLTVTGITQETGGADSVHFSAWKSEAKICCLGECGDTFQHCCCGSSIVAEEDGGEVVWSADPTRMLLPCCSPELWGVIHALSLRHALGSLSHL